MIRVRRGRKLVFVRLNEIKKGDVFCLADGRMRQAVDDADNSSPYCETTVYWITVTRWKRFLIALRQFLPW